MGRVVAIGAQDFGSVIRGNYFLVDKTAFIKEWWENGDAVTLIARPRRFGKTLNISMLDYFFSVKYKNGGNLFEGLSIWKEEKYRRLQGTYPVISLSFANIKETNYEDAYISMCSMMREVYEEFEYILKGDGLPESCKNNLLTSFTC